MCHCSVAVPCFLCFTYIMLYHSIKKHCLVLTSRGCLICFFAGVIARCPLSCISCVFFSKVTYLELLTKFRNVYLVILPFARSISVRRQCNAVVVALALGAAAAAGHLARRHRRPARSYRCRSETVVSAMHVFRPRLSRPVASAVSPVPTFLLQGHVGYWGARCT